MGKDSKWFRAGISHGLSENEGRVDKKNGIIYGMSVITKGEARSHGMWADDNFLNDVVKQGNALNIGLKTRFGHPNASSTALGTFLGREKNFRRIGDKVYSDLYFDKTAYKTPNGDLATYTMDLAESDPKSFGASITFDRDLELEKEVNRKEPREDGLVITVLKQLSGCDTVDSPAANPAGLFSDTNMQFSEEMTVFLDKFLANPEAVDNVMGFLERYKENKSSDETKETYDCECIECGYKETTDKHCQDIKCPKCDGTMRRAKRPGTGQEQEEKKETNKTEKKDTLQEKIITKKEVVMGDENKGVLKEKIEKVDKVDRVEKGEVRVDGKATEELKKEVQANKDEIVELTRKNVALEVGKFMSDNENRIMPAFEGLAKSLLEVTYPSKNTIKFAEADGTKKEMSLSEGIKELLKRLPKIELGDTGKIDTKKVLEELDGDAGEIKMIKELAKEKSITEKEARDELLAEGKIKLVYTGKTQKEVEKEED